MWPNPKFPADLVTFTQKILNGKLLFLCSDSFSKIYEQFLNEQPLHFVNLSLSEPYRSGYSANHLDVIRLIENWRYTLENNLFISAVLMDLSKSYSSQSLNSYTACIWSRFWHSSGST